LALRQLKVMVFKADIITDGRSAANSAGATRQEVHRFLLTDERGQPISSVKDRKIICNRVLGVLLQ
jgi:hypothetical protein